MEKSNLTLREICENAQEEFFKANGYYPTDKEAIELTEEARLKLLKESECR